MQHCVVKGHFETLWREEKKRKTHVTNIFSISKQIFYPLTHYQTTKFLDWSKLKEFADDNFKFDENGRRSSKRKENTVGKGEIACYQQFLLVPQCFQDLYCRHSVVW